MTKERSRFEKWALDRFYDCSRNAADEYSHVYTVAKWDGWQARAALEDRQEAATTCEKCNSQFEYCVETSGWYCPKCDIRCDGPGVPSEATPSKENAPANLLCDQIDPVTLAEHTKHVEQFLNEMYATMIDPVEQPSMKVSEICALLLKTASEQREQLAAPEVQPDEEDTSTEADLPRYLLMLKLEKERAPEVQGTPTEHAENCEFQPKSAETEQIDCTCVGTPQKETPPSKCNCGSHKLAPLYHHPDCPKCQKTAPVPEGVQGKEPQTAHFEEWISDSISGLPLDRSQCDSPHAPTYIHRETENCWGAYLTGEAAGWRSAITEFEKWAESQKSGLDEEATGKILAWCAELQEKTK